MKQEKLVITDLRYFRNYAKEKYIGSSVCFFEAGETFRAEVYSINEIITHVIIQVSSEEVFVIADDFFCIRDELVHIVINSPEVQKLIASKLASINILPDALNELLLSLGGK